jgi:hypothetical protein
VSTIDKVVVDVHIKTLHVWFWNHAWNQVAAMCLTKHCCFAVRQESFYKCRRIKRPAAGDPSLHLRSNNWNLVVAPHFPVRTADPAVTLCDKRRCSRWCTDR